MSMAGPLPRWLWDPTTCAWLLLRADGTLREEGGPDDPPMPAEPSSNYSNRPARPFLDPPPLPVLPTGGIPLSPGAGDALENAVPCHLCGCILGTHLPECPHFKSGQGIRVPARHDDE